VSGQAAAKEALLMMPPLLRSAPALRVSEYSLHAIEGEYSSWYSSTVLRGEKVLVPILHQYFAKRFGVCESISIG